MRSCVFVGSSGECFQGTLAGDFLFMKDFPGTVPGQETDGLLSTAGWKIPFVFANALHCKPANNRVMQAPFCSWMQSYCHEAHDFSL